MKILKITQEELACILRESTLVGCNDTTKIQVNVIEHESIGRAITVKPCGNGALLIWRQNRSATIDMATVNEWLDKYCDCNG